MRVDNDGAVLGWLHLVPSDRRGVPLELDVDPSRPPSLPDRARMGYRLDV
jgi:hypothetical protein